MSMTTARSRPLLRRLIIMGQTDPTGMIAFDTFKASFGPDFDEETFQKLVCAGAVDILDGYVRVSFDGLHEAGHDALRNCLDDQVSVLHAMALHLLILGQIGARLMEVELAQPREIETE